MDVMNMKEKLEACYGRLQTLYDLQEVYKELERMEADGRTAADPERQPDD